MADLTWSPSPDLTWATETPAKEASPPLEQDGAITRGAKQAVNSARRAGDLLLGDYASAADRVAEADTYRRANPGTPEGNELMAAWERGDGVAGGVSEVAGEMAKDWNEAPSTMGKLRATGKNLAAMGGGIIEQIPNMVAPMGGMLLGGAAGSLAGPAGTVGGAFAGATAGNTAMETGEQVDRALMAAGINPQDKAAVQAFLAQNGDKVLGQATTKGAIIGAVDTATMGLSHFLLSAPGKAAANRALSEMGIDAADHLAAKAAMQSPEFAARVAADPLAKVSLGRNAAVAALEPAGEFTGEYVGQGVATGDWDTKGATLEALSALGQGGITFAGQKLYQAATSPLRAGAPADPAATPLEQDAANAALAGTLDQYDQLGAPNAGLLPAPAADPNVIIVPTQAGGTTTVDRRDGPISDAAADAVQGGATADMLQNRSLLQSYPDQAAAQAALDLRPDGDRLRVARHPRATGRFAVVPKDAQTLRALDENRARQQQIAEEDGNATQVDAAGHTGSGDVGGGGPGDAQPDVGRQPGGSAAAGGTASSRATDSLVGDARIGDAALDELAPAPVQPVSSMPGIQARDQARIAQARAEAEARGARLVDEEASAAHPSPSTAQIAAGNYQKGHIKIGPLDLSIENPVGSTRSGTENGKAWETTMQAHYGYVKRTEGADGDQVDVFVRAGTASDHNGPVYVVDQANPKTGRFDEHKAMIGYGSAAEAARAYDAHFGDKSGPKRRKAVVAMPMADFNNWARNGDTSQPISRAAQEADAAQAEIASSTGLQSKSRRQEGESDTAYHARMAAESNARKQGKATSEAKPAPVTDHQKTVAEVIGADPAEVSIVAAKDLPSGGKGISRQYAQFLEQVARLFKKKVVVFSSDKKVDGFWIRGDTIYVGQETSVGHLRILGHELTHVMRREAGPAYDKMLGAVRSLLTEEELRAQYLDYFGVPLEGGLEQEHEGRPLRDFLSEEWMADLSGNRFGESAFWTEVFQKIEEQYGDQQAKGIINRVRMALAAALNKILSTVSGARFAVDRRLNAHLDDIRKAVAQGFADYAIEVKRGVKPAESGAALMARGSADQTLPTRWPTAKKVTPSVDADMITDLATLKQDQTQYAKAVGAVLEEPGMHSAEMATGTLDEKAEHVIGRMQENLLWLFDQVPEAVRNRSKLWYDGARKIAEQWAKQYDITESQAAGALAVLSPQKDWFMNVTMAERVLDIIHTKMNHRFDEKMRAAAFAFLVKDAREDGQRNTKAFNRVRGKTLAEVAKHHDLRELSVWIRAYDEAYHDPKHAIVTPEGGFVEDKTTVKGEPTMRAWGDFTTPGKAASIYLDGSPENINKQLGGEHKVRNFYNNIYAPKDARFTTIDTHAVAADLLRPLAGADKPVADNFGKTGGTNVTGLSGTYALHYEAYRRAAEARGVLPREMQSITWEAVRGLFTEGFKGKKHNLTAVDAVWRQVDAGKLEAAKAREQIVEMAGGIEQPDWWNEGNAGYQEVLRDTTYAKERSSFVGAKVTFEVAPDPRNAELKARWDALPAKDKLEISDKVAWKIAAKALASFNDNNMKGELHHQAGGWMADTNPSLSIWFNKRASGTKINQFARMLGFALQQESMMRTSPRAFMGSDGKKVEASGAIFISRRAGESAEELYGKVRTVVDAKGKPFVLGHTTDNEHMAVIHQDSSVITHRELAAKIAETLGDDYTVSTANIHAEFLNKGRNSYGLRGRQANPAESSLRARADQLRAETDVLFDQLVGTGSERPAAGGDVAGESRHSSQSLGRTDVIGVHYSNQQREHLTGLYFGSGLKGEEGARLRDAKDQRLKSRLYAYVNEGQGVFPEAGVGAYAHTVEFGNLYDLKADPLGIRQKTQDANDRESMILDAGFDGYYAPGVFGRQGVAILMGGAATRGVRPTKTEAPVQARATTAADALAGRKDLPMGKMTGAEWKKLVPEAKVEDGESYYKDQLRFSPARFDRIAGEFTQRVTTALANPRNTQSVLIHGNTPASMQLIGWKDLPLRVEASELAKIANKPGFETDEQIGKLVHDLARPGAMFWNEKQGSLNLLRREDMRGAPAIIAVRADAPVNRERAHLMVTAHRLDNQEALLRKISSGELKPIYLDQANPLVKAAMQKNKYRVQTAEMLAPEKRQARDAVKLGTTSKLLSPADLVNWETEQWGDTPRFSPSRQQVEDEAFAAVERDPAGMIEEYRRRFGNIIDPDQVKQLFPAFAADPSLAAAVHEPSSKLAKLIYAEALKRNNGKPVTFTAGGGGSGKSEAMPLALAAGGLESDGLIYDSTLSSYKSAEQRIDQALATGSKVTVVYTNRPVDAAFEFAMGRSRVVPAKVLAAAHVGASDTIRQLAEHYAGNPDVAILIVNNKGAIEDMQLGQLDDVPTYAYNETERKLHDLAKQALSEGRISQERYDDLLARREQSSPAAGPQQVQEGQPGQDPGRPGERTGSEGPRLAAARSLGRRIDRVIASVDHAVDGLSNLPDQFDYLKNRYLALGKIARVDEITKEIRTAFEKTDPTNKKAVYQYLTTRGATPAAIPSPDIRAIAERIKKTIEYTGDQLVARGLLDQASRDHYRDQYLPRMYLRHMLNDQDYKVIGMGKKPSEMGYLKHRKDIPDEIREVVLGEVKDPAFLSANAIGRAMRDVSLLDWMGQISQNNDWVFPEIFVPWQGKKVTAYWLRAEADRIELQLAHYDAPAKAKAEAMVAAMRTLANNTLGAMSAVDHKKYKQIPDTMRYGLLRGMWVRKEIFDDIMGASQIVNADPTWFEDWFGFGGKGTKLTQWWKFTKVALNPPGQIRNFVSNMVMLQLSGVGLHKLPLRLVQAAREITNDGPHWKVAKKYGVTESTFTAQELFRIKRDLVALESQQGKMNSLRWLMNAGAHFLERVSDLYQFSEALGKTIKIIDEMEKGKSEAEAAIEAQKWLFDYSLVPQTVRIARNAPVGMPFLTYQIKVLPRLLEVAAKHPWRFLPWAGLLYGMQAAVASMFGVDDDELEKLKKALPQWLQDRGHTVFLPMRDADGRIQVADVGYFFPWTYYSTAAKHAAEGNMKKLIADDIFGMMSAPIIGGASALISNYDNFSKRPIYNEADPVGYQAAAIANYTYDLMAPPFLSSHGVVSPMGLVDTKFGGKLVQAETGQTNRFGDPRATEGQAIGALVGANFYGMDPEHTRVTNLMVMNSKVLAAERALKARLMDRGLGDEAKAALIRDYQAKMMELNKEMLEYSKESEVPPQLKRTNR